MTYKLVSFDLDGTLAVSKSALDEEMSDLLAKLLEKYQVAIISGGDFPQFQKQVINQLRHGAKLENLLILPTSGAKMYRYTNGTWDMTYCVAIPETLRREIVNIIYQTIHKLNFVPQQTWGPQVEDRQSQITFSALGQQAPPDVKLAWDPDTSKRVKIVDILQPLLPEVKVSFGGSTSIDIVQPGIDKGFGITKIMEYTHLTVSDILFIGDRLEPNGNDFPVIATGIDTLQIHSLFETKEEIKKLL